ncbi:MAG: helix-turn-helix transcriptional regulator [Elusimicrobia bacterium]|nr:helix-turn-helix transcriptional regulator [Elusimicrobiota bacterium]
MKQKEMQKIYENIGQKIRFVRKAKKLTLEDLAFKINMDWSFLARIETGKTVASLETLYKIAKTLGISLEELFKNVDDIKNKAINKEFSNLLAKIPQKEKDKIISIIKIILDK